MKLYVVRHGEVPANVNGIISGKNDEKLTNKGIVQAKKAKELLLDKNIDYIYSSPVERAKQTAKIIVPNKKIIYDERLSEREPGNMFGKSRKEIDNKIWNSLEFDRTKEGAETLASGLKRAYSFLIEKQNQHSEKTLLIVTHMFISKAIWVLENNVYNMDEIISFKHFNGDVKYYEGNIEELSLKKILKDD